MLGYRSRLVARDSRDLYRLGRQMFLGGDAECFDLAGLFGGSCRIGYSLIRLDGSVDDVFDVLFGHAVEALAFIISWFRWSIRAGLSEWIGD